MSGMFDDLIPQQGQQQQPQTGGGGMFADLIPSGGAAAQPQGQKSYAQLAADRLRYINDVMTLGAWDRLVGAGRAAAGGTPYQQAYQQEAAQTRAARESLSIPEQIGYGVVGGAPLAAAGGALGLIGRAATGGGATTAGTALQRAATTAAPTLGQRAAIGAAEVGLQGATEAAIKGEDIGTGAATGMALGAGLPVALSALGRVASPIRNQLTEPQKQLAKEAEKRGIQLTPAQATGSKAAQFFESQLRDLPGGGMSPRLQQQEQLQRMALREAGVDSPYATADAIETGFRNIGQTFEQSLQGRNIRLGEDFEQIISAASNRYSNRLEANVKDIFDRLVTQLRNEPETISGIRANNIRSDIASLEREYKNNPSLRRALGSLREAVDVSISQSLPKDVSAQINRAREQYKNLYRIDDVMSRAGPQAESGMIPFVQLNNLIKQKQGSISRGVNAASPEFQKLSQIGATFFREPPSSGTSQRNYMTALLTGGLGAGSFMAGGLPGLAAAIGTPLATNLVYNRPLVQRMLAQQRGRALERTPQQLLTSAGTAGLGLLGQ